ncbi:pilin [Nocardia miyunensis]|uniref:pilin n=1 Tax=Nocardia miyunensis TaxID=282684 RepID=UPI000831F945|nr:pilin [Nocardia miyunensis]
MTRLPDTMSAVLGRIRLARVRRPVLAIAWAVVAVLAVLVFVAGPAAAATPPVQVASSLDEVLDHARNWLIGILSAVATVCLTVAGVRYVIASGDPGELEKAKAAFRAACLGYVVAMLAPVIVAILKSIVAA